MDGTAPRVVGAVGARPGRRHSFRLSSGCRPRAERIGSVELRYFARAPIAGRGDSFGPARWRRIRLRGLAFRGAAQASYEADHSRDSGRSPATWLAVERPLADLDRRSGVVARRRGVPAVV